MSSIGPPILSAVCAIGSPDCGTKSFRIRNVWTKVVTWGRRFRTAEAGLEPTSDTPSDPSQMRPLVHLSPSYVSSVNSRRTQRRRPRPRTGLAPHARPSSGSRKDGSRGAPGSAGVPTAYAHARPTRCATRMNAVFVRAVERAAGTEAPEHPGPPSSDGTLDASSPATAGLAVSDVDPVRKDHVDLPEDLVPSEFSTVTS